MKMIILPFFLLFLSVTELNANDIPQPYGMVSVWVGDNLLHNGIPVKIKKFSSSIEVTDVINFYKNLWGKKSTEHYPGYIESRVSGWSIISRLEGGSNTVIQVKESKLARSEGFISVSKPFTEKNKKGINFPMINGSTFISLTQSNEFGEESKTFILKNNTSIASNFSYYKKEMTKDGWKLSHSLKDHVNSILFLSKKNKKIEIAMHRNKFGMTSIVANITEK